MGFVYKWVNNLNGKWYIGSHCGKDKNYNASGVAINRAFDKYGIENFTKYVIYEGDDYRLIEELSLQSHNAAKNNQSYNMKNNAVGWEPGHKINLGRTLTPEIRSKISAATKGSNNPRYSVYSINNQTKFLGISHYLAKKILT